MSRLIDADKLKECDFVEYGYEMRYEIDRTPTADVIPIPEGATNGDMLTALFGERALITLDTHNYLKDWWNAPYKKEVEESIYILAEQGRKRGN